jgi:hypothetical protein
MTLHNIASLEIVLAAQDRGRGNFEEALKLTREVGDTASELLVLAGLISSLVRLGETELAQGRIGEMASKLAELSDVGGARESIYGLEAVAEYLVAIGRPADAALALGAASEARRRLSMPHSSVESRDTAVLREALEAALGREEVETRLATGSTSPLNEAFSAAAIASGSVQPH